MTQHILKPATVQVAKDQARRLRDDLAKSGTVISHSRALELIAHQFGHKDWNTFHAALGNGPALSGLAGLKLGQTVQGQYLGQYFSAELIGLQSLSGGSRYRVTLHLNTPVDVVTFDSFSALRSRISGNVNSEGISAEKTSDGAPQLILELSS